MQLYAAKREHFERYLHHSSYVKTLDVSSESPEVCELLEKSDAFIMELGLNNRHFPKLAYFGISPSLFTEPLTYLRTRGNSELKGLRIHLKCGSHGSWLQEIPQSYETITCLDLVLVDHTARGDSPQLDLIHNLDLLVRLKMLYIQIDSSTIHTILRKAGKLPFLEILNLKISEHSRSREDHFQELKDEPPAEQTKLLQLGYEGKPAGDLHAILSLSKSSGIAYQSITLTITTATFPYEVEKIVEWINSSHPGIRVVSLKDETKPLRRIIDQHIRANTDLRPRTAILPRTLTLLAHLHNLRYLVLHTFGGCALDPAVLDTFAASLRHLIVCSFSPYKLHWQGVTVVNIRLIHAVKFAVQCPTLRRFGIYCSALRPGDPSLDSDVLMDGRSELKTLAVGHSLIDDAPYVASILRRFLPVASLDIWKEMGIHDSLASNEDECRLWLDVKNMLSAE